MSFQGFLNFWGRRQSDSKPLAKKGLTANDFDKIATVEKKIDLYHRGRIRYQGTYWYAMLNEEGAVFPGERVLVVGREAMTLIVQPFETPHSPQQSQVENPRQDLSENQPAAAIMPHLRLVKPKPASEKGA